MEYLAVTHRPHWRITALFWFFGMHTQTWHILQNLLSKLPWKRPSKKWLAKMLVGGWFSRFSRKTLQKTPVTDAKNPKPKTLLVPHVLEFPLAAVGSFWARLWLPGVSDPVQSLEVRLGLFGQRRTCSLGGGVRFFLKILYLRTLLLWLSHK